MTDFRVKRGAGFTIVELLVSILVFAIFITGVIYVYRHSSDSYRASSWKQERTLEVEMFWNALRKPLEEATNKLDRVGAPPNWMVQTTPRPLKLKTSATGNAPILAWEVDHLDNMGMNTNLKYQVDLSNRELVLSGGDLGKPAIVRDVAQVEVRSTQIRQKPLTFEEYLDMSGTGDPVVGSVVEISFVLEPPPGFPIPGIRLNQSHKFKLQVEALASL
jgi:hypothetical protein